MSRNGGKSSRPARASGGLGAGSNDNEDSGSTLSRIHATLDAIEEANGRLHAFSEITPEHALGGAEMADKLASVGARLGPLHGLPIVVKDIIDVTGLPTRAGSLTRKTVKAVNYDAQVVSRLRAAGAIIVAKTNTVEYAFGGWGTNETAGTPRNPWDLKVHRVPGGSSSGTGVAVGAGLVPAGLGTDTGGSVRQPAALCGCVGLKTSIGLVGRSGVTPLCGVFDTIGPLTDTVRRAALMLSVMQGEDPLDRSTQGIQRADPLADLDRGVEGLRLGRLRDEDMPLMTAEVAKSFKAALAKLEQLGAIITPFKPPRTLEDYTRRCGTIIAVEAYAHYGDLVEDPKSQLNTAIRTRMLTGKAISVGAFNAAEWVADLGENLTLWTRVSQDLNIGSGRFFAFTGDAFETAGPLSFQIVMEIGARMISPCKNNWNNLRGALRNFM